MKHLPAATLAVAVVTFLGGLHTASAAAQNARPASRGTAADQPRTPPPLRGALRHDLAAPYDGNAEETRRRLYEVLQQYPPSLREVLRLDPSLLTNPVYLEPYPALAEFLDAHPEVAHNPGFFIPDYRSTGDYRDTPKLAVIRTMEVSVPALTSPLALSLVVALFALAVLAPVALYLVLSDE